MAEPLRVCLWATTFQANIYSLAKYLATQPERFDPMVVLEGLDAYSREPISKLARVGCPLLDRAASDTRARLSAFEPTVLVVDNHYPPMRVAPALVNVWHGFGWRGPEDREAFAGVFADIEKHTGISPAVPNPYLRWITAGPTNLEHRLHVTGFHADNLRPAGQAFVDDVMSASWTRADLAPFYPAAFRGKRVALFAPTWHFGRIFAHWGDDMAVLERLFAFLAAHDVALILRMHDRKRFEASYLLGLERLASRHEHVLFKYKDEAQDNLLDLLVSDLMISNYSSILTYFYATGRPSIHVHPVDRDAQASVYRYWKRGKVRSKTAEASYVWSLDPDENGGLVVESQDELEAAILLGLTEPDCCTARSRQFVKAHCAPYDGRNCERIAAIVEEVGRYALEHPPKRGLLATLLGR